LPILMRFARWWTGQPSSSPPVLNAGHYIQLWNGDVEILTENLDYIRKAASQVLETLTDA